MSVNANLPVLYMGLSQLQQVTHVEQSHPEVQQTVAEQMAKEKHKEEQKQVQDAEKPDASRTVDEDGRGGGGAGGRQARGGGEPEPEEKPPTEAHDDSPWSGNIVNRKV